MVDDIGDSDEKAVSQSSESRARKNSGSKKSASRPAGRKEIKKALDIVFDEIIECPESVSDRVDYIADIMSELKWVRGKTGKLLARKWNLSESTVGAYAAEASRMVTADRESAVRDITNGAMKLFRESIVNSDAKSAKMMGDLLAAVSGANAPSKQEIAHTLGEATPKTARDVMAVVFKGGVGEGVSDDENGDSNRPTLDNTEPALADPEDDNDSVS